MLFKKYLKRAAAVALGTLTIATALAGCNAPANEAGAADDSDAISKAINVLYPLN